MDLKKTREMQLFCNSCPYLYTKENERDWYCDLKGSELRCINQFEYCKENEEENDIR